MSQPPSAPGDLGFGGIGTRSDRRLLNRDGTFNVRREGLGLLRGRSLYHALLTVSWPAFLGVVSLVFLAVNALFAVGFLLCADPPGSSMPHNFAEAFFFSTHTFATIGYGNMAPQGTAANLLVVGESLAGLLLPALATGMTFARIARPTTRVLFSDVAVIAPYGDGSAFMFRLANGWANELSTVEIQVLLSLRRRTPEGIRRDYRALPLERPSVQFFPLTWTVVHPIDEASPLSGLTPAALAESEAEFLVLLTAHDETFAQGVQARTSYRAEEVVDRARFADIYERAAEHEPLTVDVRRLSEIVRLDADQPGD